MAHEESHEHRRPPRPADWPEVVKRTPDQVEFDLLAEMAKDPANGLELIAPGVYRASDPCLVCLNKGGHYGWNSGPC